MNTRKDNLDTIKIKKTEDQWSCNAHLTLGPGQGERFCMGIQSLGTSSGSILKLLLFHHFVPVPERSLLPHYFMIFCFISYMHII